MNKVFWFFETAEAYYEDQCQKALAEGRIQEVPSIPTWNAQEDYHEKWHYDEGEPYTRHPYSEALEFTTRPYVVISEREWENLVYDANRKQMDIVNNPETNLPMLKEREPVDPTSREALESELAECHAWFKKAGGSDELACKCMCEGLVFKDTYPSLYAEGVAKRKRINEIERELNKTEISKRIEAKEYPTRQDARDAVGLLYTNGDITLDGMNELTVKIDEVYGDGSIQL